MDAKQDKFMQELLADFKVEAAEHLTLFTNGLLELEKGVAPEVAKQIVEDIFREIHSAKGAARAVNLSEIERVCQSLESALASLKGGRIEVSPALLDTLHDAGDLISTMLSDLTKGTRVVKGEDAMTMVFLLTDVAQGKIPEGRMEQKREQQQPIPEHTSPVPAEHDAAIPVQPSVSSVAPHDAGPSSDTVRISVEKLRSVMLQTEEFVSTKATFRNFAEELSEISSGCYSFRKISESRIRELHPGSNPDPLAWEELLKWYKESSRELHERILRITKQFGQYQHDTSRMVDDMLLTIRKTLLVPFSGVLDLFPKMVRDLARDNGKEVRLNIQGGLTEIDRRILEEIKDPLIHLIRNCIDHGIENPDGRTKVGKSRQGLLEILVTKPQEREIAVVIRDDGAGIRSEQVIRSAIREGVITDEAAHNLSQEDALQLIFQSGVSTSAMITDISGRGLGLAIVAEKINKLGGQVTLQSEEGKGTTFTLKLPLTLATFRGVLARLGENLVMIPLSNVEKVARVDRVQVRTIEERQTLVHEDHQIPLAILSEILGFSTFRNRANPGHRYIIILSSGIKKTGFIVDAIIGEQEGMIKPLGGQLLNVKHVSGATALGDGRVVPVLDPYELIESVARSASFTIKEQHEVDGAEAEKPKRILIAEDSLTSRALLRNLLESAGYAVTTAVDGWDGYTLVKQGGFDLVVSDVEMPRMNGFEFTTKIRGESELSSLPVILVTALESPEDRQRGLEAGANAYIVKSTFEGGNLVSTIQRLI